jgi:hypothetical protein
MNNLSRENRVAFMVLAVAQSLLLLLLHKAIDHQFWPSEQPAWLFALYTLVIGFPLFLYLGAVQWRDKANAWAALLLAPVLFWAGWHHGWLSAPTVTDTDYRYMGGLGMLGCGLLVALFILGFFFRTWREQGRLEYVGLLENSWRNALTLMFLGLFLLVFWLLLWLWAMLFAVLNIEFFKTLFSEPVFIYPVTGLVVGWGLGLIRARESLVATVRRLCEALTRALLPLLSLILILFLAVLPFKGITLLWETGRAAWLMLWLAGILLYFTNAAMADEERPFAASIWLRRLLTLTLVLLPVTVVLALWALGVRIDQYGLSLARLWGLLVAVFAGLFSVGYAVLIIWRRGLCADAMQRWNIGLGGALAVTLVLINTPLLDFHKLAAKSQVARLERGTTAPEDFDVRYLRFNLGAYGVNALRALQAADWVTENAELLASIESALSSTNRFRRIELPIPSDAEQRRQRVMVLPGTEVTDNFLLALDTGHTLVSSCLMGVLNCVVGDFDYSGERHRALSSVKHHWNDGPLWRWHADGWTPFGSLRRVSCSEGAELESERPFEALPGAYALVAKDGCVFQVQPSVENAERG